MPGSILGNRVVRKEDPKFLTTGGVYLDDLHDVPELDGRGARRLRPLDRVAHGTITSIDTAEAAGDARRARRVHGRRPRPRAGAVAVQPDRRRARCSRRDRVRYVGEPIAAVVAETREQATDAAEAVVVDYDAARRGRRPGGGARRRRRSSTRPPAATPCSTRPRSACPT